MRFSPVLLFLSLPMFGAGTVNLAPVGKWIAGQRELQSLTADFVQTRSLKTLRDPLANPGRLYFRAPDAFRWELGQPARAILLRNRDHVFLIEPAKKKATRFSASALEPKSGTQGLLMMKFPMAKNVEDFKAQFDVIDLQEIENDCEVSLLPKDANARKFLQSLTFRFVKSTGELRFFEMTTREGSKLRNDFSHVRVNEKIDPAIFEYDLAGFEITDAKN